MKLRNLNYCLSSLVFEKKNSVVTQKSLGSTWASMNRHQQLRLELPPPAVGALSLSDALDKDYMLDVEASAAPRKRKGTARKRSRTREEEEEEQEGDDGFSSSPTPTFSLPRAAVLSLGRAGVTRQALAAAQAALAAAAAAAAMSVLAKEKEGNHNRALPRPSLSLLRSRGDGAAEASGALAAAAAATAAAPLPGRLSLAVSAAVHSLTFDDWGKLPARARADAWLSDAASFESAVAAAAAAAVSLDSSSSSSSAAADCLLPAIALEPEVACRATRMISEWLARSSGHPRLWRLAEKVWRCCPQSSSFRRRRSLRRRDSSGSQGSLPGSLGGGEEEEKGHLERLREALLGIGRAGAGSGGEGGDDQALVAAAAAAAEEEEKEGREEATSFSCPLWLSLAPAKTACERCLELLFSHSPSPSAGGKGDEERREKERKVAASLAARFFVGCGPSSEKGEGRGGRRHGRVSETLLLAASRAPSCPRSGHGKGVLSWAAWLSGDGDGDGNGNGNGSGDRGGGEEELGEGNAPYPPSPGAVLGPWVSRVMLPLAWLSSSSASKRKAGGEEEVEGEEKEEGEALLLLLRRVGEGGGASIPSLGTAFKINAAQEALEWARARGREWREVEEGLERAVARAKEKAAECKK